MQERKHKEEMKEEWSAQQQQSQTVQLKMKARVRTVEKKCAEGQGKMEELQSSLLATKTKCEETMEVTNL